MTTFTDDPQYFRAPDGTRYRVTLQPDYDAESPRDNDGNVTVMHTFGGGFISPDDGAHGFYRDAHPSGSEILIPGEYLDLDTGANRVVNMRRASKWAALNPSILFIAGLRHESRDGSLGLDDGIRGDSDAEGYVVITRDAWTEHMGDEPPTPDRLRVMVDAEIAQYNTWAEGGYVGFVVEALATWTKETTVAGVTTGTSGESWEIIDSCWGFDDPEYAFSEALAALPDGCRTDEDGEEQE